MTRLFEKCADLFPCQDNPIRLMAARGYRNAKYCVEKGKYDVKQRTLLSIDFVDVTSIFDNRCSTIIPVASVCNVIAMLFKP